MKQNNTDSTLKKETVDWAVGSTLSDAEILEYGKEVLSSPTMTLTPTDISYPKENFYSTDQMLKMFREGYLVMTRTDFGKKILEAKKLLSMPKPYTVLRRMQVGEIATFPYEKWAAARSAASQIKKEFGSSFKVRKKSPQTEVGEIEVKRLS